MATETTSAPLSVPSYCMVEFAVCREKTNLALYCECGLCIVYIVFFLYLLHCIFGRVALACMQFNLQCNNVPILCLSCFSLFGRAGNRWDGTGGHSHSPALFFFSSFRDSLSANQEA